MARAPRGLSMVLRALLDVREGEAANVIIPQRTPEMPGLETREFFVAPYRRPADTEAYRILSSMRRRNMGLTPDKDGLSYRDFREAPQDDIRVALDAYGIHPLSAMRRRREKAQLRETASDVVGAIRARSAPAAPAVQPPAPAPAQGAAPRYLWEEFGGADPDANAYHPMIWDDAGSGWQAWRPYGPNYMADSARWRSGAAQRPSRLGFIHKSQHADEVTTGVGHTRRPNGAVIRVTAQPGRNMMATAQAADLQQDAPAVYQIVRSRMGQRQTYSLVDIADALQQEQRLGGARAKDVPFRIETTTDRSINRNSPTFVVLELSGYDPARRRSVGNPYFKSAEALSARRMGRSMVEPAGSAFSSDLPARPAGSITRNRMIYSVPMLLAMLRELMDEDEAEAA